MSYLKQVRQGGGGGWGRGRGRGGRGGGGGGDYVRYAELISFARILIYTDFEITICMI